MDQYSQHNLKRPATEPEHAVRKAEFDLAADRIATLERSFESLDNLPVGFQGVMAWTDDTVTQTNGAVWLKCDGSAFDPEDYPELAELLSGMKAPVGLKMTDYNRPSPQVVTESSQKGDGYGWHAFDGRLDGQGLEYLSGWFSASVYDADSGSGNEWWQIDYGTENAAFKTIQAAINFIAACGWSGNERIGIRIKKATAPYAESPAVISLPSVLEITAFDPGNMPVFQGGGTAPFFTAEGRHFTSVSYLDIRGGYTSCFYVNYGTAMLVSNCTLSGSYTRLGYARTSGFLLFGAGMSFTGVTATTSGFTAQYSSTIEFQTNYSSQTINSGTISSASTSSFIGPTNYLPTN